MPSADGRPRVWKFTQASRSREVHIATRIAVNDALTIHRLIRNGAGIDIISGYLAAPEIGARRLLQLLPDWELRQCR